jgi:hypothetical protein
MPIQYFPSVLTNPDWGNITGSISAQSDLQTLLDAKSEVNHILQSEQLDVSNDEYFQIPDMSLTLEANQAYIIDLNLLVGNRSRMIYKIEFTAGATGWIYLSNSDYSESSQFRWGLEITNPMSSVLLDTQTYQTGNVCAIQHIDKIKCLLHTGDSECSFVASVKKYDNTYPDFDIKKYSFMVYQKI